jgi:hypothetical protein
MKIERNARRRRPLLLEMKVTADDTEPSVSRSAVNTWHVNVGGQELYIIMPFRSIVFKCARLYIGRAAVAQLVEALRYKPAGRGFDSRWCHWNFSLWPWGRLSL